MWRTLVISVALLTSGCTSKHVFAPPPYNYERWVRPGTEEVTIWKDLLECNYPQPFGGGAKIEGGRRTINEVVGSMICMETLGYSYIEERRVRRVCEIPAWKGPGAQACLAGKDVPIPNAERRLSGGYCRQYPKSRACVP